MRKADEIVTTRKMYKDMKKFDRQQYDNFCKDLYKKGFENGRASVPKIDYSRIYEIIGGIKGIGEKRLDEIKEKLETEFKEEA